jgi:hypothetical protein
VRIRFRLGKEHSVMSGIMHIDTMRSTKARVPFPACFGEGGEAGRVGRAAAFAWNGKRYGFNKRGVEEDPFQAPFVSHGCRNPMPPIAAASEIQWRAY